MPTVKKYPIIIGIIIIFLFPVYVYFHSPPKNFPLGQVITIEPGQSLQDVTNMLYDNSVIRSRFFFRTHAIIQGGEKRIIAGDYLLDRKEGSADIAYRLVHGQFHLEAAKVTIPEGWNVYQISNLFKKKLINFNEPQFLSLAKKKEGYLFPDTYFIFPTAKSEDIISMMNKNYNEKIKTVPGIATSTLNLKDVIIMASILEGEARTTENRRIIAGILWKRLSLGMPLQADATFSYINGKNSFDITPNDLKIDSPYNTYLYKGLPPGPIGNPGVDAIFSAISPKKTKYFYFIASKDGVVHYATTFDEHKRNIEKYLK